MAVTYDFEFKFNPGQLSIRSLRKPGDGISSNNNFGIDVTQKVAMSLSSAVGPAVALGANAGFGAIFTVPGSSTLSLDLQAIDLVDDREDQVLVRYKFLLFMLLNVAQGGTACTGVEIGNAASNAHLLFLGGATDTFILDSGDFVIHGKNLAAGEVVDATHKAILATNLDSVDGALLVAGVGGLS